MLQIKEMTKEEKIEMYKKVDKLQLIEMLIEANNHLDRLTKDVKPKVVGNVNGLQSLNGKDFTYELMVATIEEFDMYETEEDDGISVALTNYATNTPSPDCGKFYFNTDNTYSFKLY